MENALYIVVNTILQWPHCVMIIFVFQMRISSLRECVSQCGISQATVTNRPQNTTLVRYWFVTSLLLVWQLFRATLLHKVTLGSRLISFCPAVAFRVTLPGEEYAEGPCEIFHCLPFHPEMAHTTSTHILLATDGRMITPNWKGTDFNVPWKEKNGYR